MSTRTASTTTTDDETETETDTVTSTRTTGRLPTSLTITRPSRNAAAADLLPSMGNFVAVALAALVYVAW